MSVEYTVHQYAEKKATNDAQVLVEKETSQHNAKEALLSGFEDTSSKSWKELTALKLNRKRSHHSCLVLGKDDKEVIVVGGYEKKNQDAKSVLRSIEACNRSAEKQKWDKKNYPKPNTNRAEHGGVKIDDNEVYIIGGRDVNGNFLDTIEAMDMSKKEPQWRTLGDIKLSNKKCGASALTVGKYVYVIGGKIMNTDTEEDSSSPSPSLTGHVDIIDTINNKLIKGPPLSTPRYGSKSILMNNNTIYVVGGQDSNGNSLNTIESLTVNPDKPSPAASWKVLKNVSLATPRTWPAVCPVAHCILVIGGIKEDNETAESEVLSSVEVFDTKRNVVWNCTSLNKPLYGSTAITIGENRVAVVGGSHSKKQEPTNTMHIMQLEFTPYDTQIDAIERELQIIRSNYDNGGVLKKIRRRVSTSTGNNNNNGEDAAAKKAKLKAYLKELKKEVLSGRHNSTYDDSDDEEKEESYDSDNSSVDDDIGRYFKNGLPSYDDGKIVAKKELKNSGQARVFKGTLTQSTSSNSKKDGKHGKNNSKKQDVAIKVFKSKKDWDDCKQELKTLLRISGHPNVMEVLDFFEVPMPAFVMRYISGGDLLDRLQKKGRFTPKRAVPLLEGIGVGLYHLHSNGIVHRDLKSPNIMLEGKGDAMRPVLIDLGLGKSIQTSHLAEESAPLKTQQFKTRGLKGTAHWMAPEMISHGKWNNKTDMFALGVIMWEILTGHLPYPTKSFNQILDFVVQKNGRPDYGQMKQYKVSQKHQNIIHRLWDKDPSNRPSAEEFITIISGTP